MTEEQKLIYLAGIVDGEGCFWRGGQKNGRGISYPQSRIIVDNTSRPLIDWLLENYGGSVSRKTKEKPHHKDAWSWRMYGKKAEELGKRLQPYLIVKAEGVKKILPKYYGQ